MKRSLLGLFGCLLATSVMAQGPVYSVNIVGFQKLSIEKGKLYLIATAFEDIDGNPLRSADVLGNQLPNLTEAHFYKGPPEPVYVSDSKGFAGWGTNIAYRGFMGFWLKIPNTALPATQTVWEVVLKGQVPMDGTASNVIASGLNMLGFPYTADVVFSNTALYANSGNSDELHVFNTQTTNYTSFSKGFAGWDTPPGFVLRQGMGFWYRRAGGTFLDTEVRPYPTN